MLRIRDVYPGSQVSGPGTLIPDLGSRIPDPGSRIRKHEQKRGVTNFFGSTFFCSHKNHKMENYINFEPVEEKIWANLQRIRELSTQIIVLKLSKIWIWDTRTGKKPFSGSRIQESKRHWIPDPGPGIRDPQHRHACILVALDYSTDT
jgi:hypothetical protein